MPITGGCIGRRVTVIGKGDGVLSFFGSVVFSTGEWCGITLDEATGKHDGSVNGKRYFKCIPNHGLFVPAKQVQLLPLDADPPPKVRKRPTEEKLAPLAPSSSASSLPAAPASANAGNAATAAAAASLPQVTVSGEADEDAMDRAAAAPAAPAAPAATLKSAAASTRPATKAAAAATKPATKPAAALPDKPSTPAKAATTATPAAPAATLAPATPASVSSSPSSSATASSPPSDALAATPARRATAPGVAVTPGAASKPRTPATKPAASGSAAAAPAAGKSPATTPGSRPRDAKPLVRSSSARRPGTTLSSAGMERGPPVQEAPAVTSAPVSPQAARRASELSTSAPPSVLRAARQQLASAGLPKVPTAEMLRRVRSADMTTKPGELTARADDSDSDMEDSYGFGDSVPESFHHQQQQQHQQLRQPSDRTPTASPTSQLAAGSDGRPRSADISALRSQIDTLEVQKLSFEAQLEASQSQLQDLSRHTMEIHQLRATLELTQTQLADARRSEKEAAHSLATAKQALINTAKQLKKEHMEAMSAVQAELASARAQQSQQAETAGSSLDTVRRLKEAHERSILQLQETHAAELETERSQKLELKATVSQLTAEIQQLQLQLQEHSDSHQQIAMFASEAEQLKAECAMIESRTRQALNKQWEEELDRTNKAHQDALTNLRAQLEASNREVKELQDSLRAQQPKDLETELKIKALTDQIRELTQSNDTLHNEKSRLQSDLAHSHKREADLAATVEITVKAKEQADQAVRRAQAQLSAAEEATEDSKLRVAQLTLEADDLRQQLTAARERLEQVNTERSATAVDDAAARARFELESLHHVLDMKNTEAKELRKKTLLLEREIEKLTHTAAQQTEEFLRKQRQTEELEVALESKRAAHDAVIIELSRMQDTVAQMDEQNKRLINEREELAWKLQNPQQSMPSFSPSYQPSPEANRLAISSSPGPRRTQSLRRMAPRSDSQSTFG